MNTLAGQMAVNTMVKLRDSHLPIFNKNMSIESHNALVFLSPCRYEIIFGTDFLNKVGMNINFEDSGEEWYDSKLPLRDPPWDAPKDFKEMEDSLYVLEPDHKYTGTRAALSSPAHTFGSVPQRTEQSCRIGSTWSPKLK